MYRIKIVICLCVIMLHMQMSVYANGYTPETATDAIIPYEDSHIMTRLETLKSFNRMIGVNDKVVFAYCNGELSDYTPKIDIKYKTYMGRFIDLCEYFYSRHDLYNKERLNGDNRFFGRDDNATVLDIIIWMNICLGADYYHFPKDNIGYRTAMINQAIDYGLLTEDEALDIDCQLTARMLKIISERFLDSVAYNYFEGISWDIKYNHDAECKYINLFNETYKDMVVTIKNDGIYLGNNKTKYNEPYHITEDGVMMIPVRLFAEITDYDDEIIWDEDTQSVLLKKKYKGNKFDFESNLKIGMWTQECVFTDSVGTFDFAHYTLRLNDQMYVPMREMLENFAYDVIWAVE